MAKKAFVSIYFTSGKIVVAQLNSSGKKVERYATVDIPQGLISDHYVADEKAMADILGRIWKKLKIKERTVGIVIPECSTFTKSINLPKLDATEMDEAVKWQVQEYIPLEPDNTLLDWKIIGESEGEYRVLAVAVNKKLLNGYVISADYAGLFPLVVETPSLSLVRSVGEDDSAKIAIYFSYDEIIITLSKGVEILTSSILCPTTSPQTLISTLTRILRHFEEVSISKIFVGGMPTNNGYIPEISKVFKVPIEKIQFKVAGTTDADLQKIAIPLSLQYKNPSEPKSSNTVNLIPPEIISKYEGKRLHAQMWGMMLIVTLILVGCLMAIMGTYFYMVQGLSKYRNFDSFSDVSYQKSRSASDAIKNVNTLTDKVIRIESVSIYPQEVLNLLYQKKPENIVILNYKVDLENGSVSISGLAASRDDLYDFKKRIEEEGEFQKIILPLTSFEQGENIEFDMAFYYAKAMPSVKEK